MLVEAYIRAPNYWEGGKSIKKMLLRHHLFLIYFEWHLQRVCIINLISNTLAYRILFPKIGWRNVGVVYTATQVRGVKNVSKSLWTKEQLAGTYSCNTLTPFLLATAFLVCFLLVADIVTCCCPSCIQCSSLPALTCLWQGTISPSPAADPMKWKTQQRY